MTFWLLVAGAAWTALVLLLGVLIGRAMRRMDRRTEEARTATVTPAGEQPQPASPPPVVPLQGKPGA